MDVEERLKLIKKDLQEIVGEEELKKILNERDLKVYWGTAPTGRPHVGYLIPMLKIGEFLEAGCNVKILFANIHAYLDNMKSSFELLEHRTEYYKALIKKVLTSLNIDISKLEFIKGSDFQLSKEYTLDMYKLSVMASLKECKKAGAEVVKQSDNPKLGGMIYPIMQALDEQYLDVDAQFGGLDQRKILMFAREFLPKIGYKARIELMNPMAPGLSGGKMSSSDESSKIDLLDSEKIIQKKMNKAFCEEGVIEENGVLAWSKMIIFKIKSKTNEPFVIERPEKWGGNLTYDSYEALEKDFKEKKLHPMDLKQGVAKEIIKILAPLREEMEVFQGLIDEAYPEK